MFCIILLDMGGSSLLWVEPSLDCSCHGVCVCAYMSKCVCVHICFMHKICYIWKVQNISLNDSSWKAHGVDFLNVMLFKA